MQRLFDANQQDGHVTVEQVFRILEDLPLNGVFVKPISAMKQGVVGVSVGDIKQQATSMLEEGE